MEDEEGGAANEDAKRKYFRILKSFDVTTEQKKVENLLKVLNPTCSDVEATGRVPWA